MANDRETLRALASNPAYQVALEASIIRSNLAFGHAKPPVSLKRGRDEDDDDDDDDNGNSDARVASSRKMNATNQVRGRPRPAIDTVDVVRLLNKQRKSLMALVSRERDQCMAGSVPHEEEIRTSIDTGDKWLPYPVVSLYDHLFSAWLYYSFLARVGRLAVERLREYEDDILGRIRAVGPDAEPSVPPPPPVDDTTDLPPTSMEYESRFVKHIAPLLRVYVATPDTPWYRDAHLIAWAIDQSVNGRYLLVPCDLGGRDKGASFDLYERTTSMLVMQYSAGDHAELYRHFESTIAATTRLARVRLDVARELGEMIDTLRSQWEHGNEFSAKGDLSATEPKSKRLGSIVHETPFEDEFRKYVLGQREQREHEVHENVKPVVLALGSFGYNLGMYAWMKDWIRRAAGSSLERESSRDARRLLAYAQMMTVEPSQGQGAVYPDVEMLRRCALDLLPKDSATTSALGWTMGEKWPRTLKELTGDAAFRSTPAIRGFVREFVRYAELNQINLVREVQPIPVPLAASGGDADAHKRGKKDAADPGPRKKQRGDQQQQQQYQQRQSNVDENVDKKLSEIRRQRKERVAREVCTKNPGLLKPNQSPMDLYDELYGYTMGRIDLSNALDALQAEQEKTQAGRLYRYAGEQNIAQRVHGRYIEVFQHYRRSPYGLARLGIPLTKAPADPVLL